MKLTHYLAFIITTFVAANVTKAQGGEEVFPCLMDVEIAFSIAESEADEYFIINVYNESNADSLVYDWQEIDWVPLSTADHPYTDPQHPPANPRECVWFADGGDDATVSNTRTHADLPGNELLRIEISRTDDIGTTVHETSTYTYYICNGTVDAFGNEVEPWEEFFCPTTENINHSDTHFFYEGGEMHVGVSPFQGPDDDPAERLNTYFSGDNWVIPYNGDVLCASPNLDCGTHENRFLAGTTVFITPQALPALTFADEADTVVPADRALEWAFAGSPTAISLQFPAGRKLVVEGDLVAEDVKLTRVPGQSTWGGVRVSGSLYADGVTIEHAATGVKVYDPGTVALSASTLRYNGIGLDVLSNDGVTVSGSDIHENGTGVRSGVPCNTAGCNCLVACQSDFSVFDSFVRGNSGAGVLAIDATAIITDTEITGNGDTGLRVTRALVLPFLRNVVEDNGYFSDSYGVTVLSGGDLYLSPLDERGVNRLAYNSYAELAVASAGFAFAGDSLTNGYNSIKDTGSYYRVANASSTTIDAEYTYWGTAGAPPSSYFYGSVNRDNPLACDPTDNSCRLPGDATRSSARGGGSPEGSDPWAEALREEIRATRAALVANPGDEGAAGRVHRLWYLHRKDRADVLGERAQTAAVLAALRGRLVAPGLPTALRATAEAALSVEATDALSREEYEGARGLIAAWGALVEGPEPARVLLAVEAHLAAVAGDYASASALMVEVAVREEDEGLRREVAAVAALYAERAEEAGGAGGFVGAGGVAAAASGLGSATQPTTATLAVYPNPVTGVATVALALPAEAGVTVGLFDVLGRRVAVLHEGALAAGRHAFPLDGAVLPAGVYLVRVDDGAAVATRRLTVVR